MVEATTKTKRRLALIVGSQRGYLKYFLLSYTDFAHVANRNSIIILYVYMCFSVQVQNVYCIVGVVEGERRG